MNLRGDMRRDGPDIEVSDPLRRFARQMLLEPAAPTLVVVAL
jgi:hypothetical protein